MLPVSGAEQLKHSLAQPILPLSAAHNAYSRLVSCSPSNTNESSTCARPDCGGMKKFHSPAAFALALTSSMTPSTFQRSPSCASASCSAWRGRIRSEEHTSELQSLMRISYAVFCLKKKTYRSIMHYFITYYYTTHDYHNSNFATVSTTPY